MKVALAMLRTLQFVAEILDRLIDAMLHINLKQV
jgi:hypothetical protein